MNEDKKHIEKLLDSLKERAKELNCLYSIEEFVNNVELSQDQVFNGIVKVIPPGWQFPDVCEAEINQGSRGPVSGITPFSNSFQMIFI